MYCLRRGRQLAEVAMLEELSRIDLESIDQLCQIKSEEQSLTERLERMEAKRNAVTAAVYERVRADYGGQLERLAERAQPLKERARAEYATLSTLLAGLTQALEDARLAKEELGFRHDLGEFGEEDYERQLRHAEEHVAGCERDLADGMALKERFIAAFHSEAELTAADTPRAVEAAAPEEQPAEPPAAESQAPPVEEAAVSPPPPPPPAATTAELPRLESGSDATAEPAVDGENVPIVASGAVTAMIFVAWLVADLPNGRQERVNLNPGVTTIGRAPGNDIRINHGTISRHHAKITYGEQGYVVSDLGSENGVYVNGERVKERALRDGDRLEVGAGTKAYTFRAPTAR